MKRRVRKKRLRRVFRRVLVTNRRMRGWHGWYPLVGALLVNMFAPFPPRRLGHICSLAMNTYVTAKVAGRACEA